LWTWLLTYGIVVLCSAAVQIVTIILIEKLFILYILVTLLVGMFMFAWNIVGAVALFRDSPACANEAYPLWAMCLAVLIIQWIGMVTLFSFLLLSSHLFSSSSPTGKTFIFFFLFLLCQSVSSPFSCSW
jgi:hypothetical protein